MPRRRYGGTPGEPAAAAWDAACFPPPPPLRNARIRQRRAGKVEVLTERQGHTQSRKPLEIEWSSVFPIVERCRAAQEDRGGEVQRRAGGCRQQDGTVQREK